MPETKNITVQLAKPYTVTVGKGILAELHIPARSVLLYDENLPESVLAPLKSQFAVVVALPAGERCKNAQTFAWVLSQLAAANLTRDSWVYSLGGGATSDLAGYVAASYLRGVRFVNMPTTLLAMVDASVGGKTGINLPEGKNLVGAFWQPEAVYADITTLGSLSPSVFKEGMAEMFKHHLLDAHAPLSQFYTDSQSPTFVAELARSIQVKADIVAKDPFEKHERAFLNLGHTLGHAVEWAAEYRLSHGEAIAYGLHYAALLARHLGHTDLTGQTLKFLQWMQPRDLPTTDFESLYALMARDKKADSEGLRFALLKNRGEPYLARVEKALLREVFAEFLAEVEPLQQVQ